VGCRSAQRQIHRALSRLFRRTRSLSPRARTALALSGAALSWQQFILVRELACLLFGLEVVIALLLMGFFGGMSAAYALAGKLPPSRLSALLGCLLLVQASSPFAFRELAGAFSPLGSLLLLLGACALMTLPYSLVLPLLIDQEAASLSSCYAAEVAGTVLGVLTLGLAASLGNRLLLTLSLAMLALLFGLTVSRWLARVAALLLVAAYWAGFPALDAASNARFYAATQRTAEPESLYSTYSAYQKVDVIRSRRTGSTALYLDGLEYFDELTNRHFNLLLAAIPAAARSRRGPLEKALVVGAGSLNSSRYVLEFAQQVTTLELDPAVLAVGLRFFQPGDELGAEGRWRPVIEDARQFLRRAADDFDLIVLDVPAPHTLQLGALSTVEFYQLCLARLRPGGLVSLSLSGRLTAGSPVALSVASAACHAFPQVLALEPNGRGPTILLGQASGLSPQLLQEVALGWDIPFDVVADERIRAIVREVPPTRMDSLHAVVLQNRRALRGVYGLP